MDELKKFREGKRLTQNQMASKIGVSLSYYRKVEQGEKQSKLSVHEKAESCFPEGISR